MKSPILLPLQKAHRLNLDSSKYGAFAEIGAGQEIARWFFLAGGAAGTVAKTMSAYDMTVSDAIYGKCRRYVSRERLLQMLDHEYQLLHARLSAPRGENTTFFVIANTVATRSYTRTQDGSAWIGIRFQHAFGVEPSQIVLHARLLDDEYARQQDAVGILGVNLVHGAFYLKHRIGAFMESLLDNLSRQRVEINMLDFSGPAFERIDNRLMSLRLVEGDFTRATVFAPDGHVVQAGELLYGRPLLILRGGFRPVTNTVMDIVEQAHASGLISKKDKPVPLLELTLKDLRARRRIQPDSFLLRTDMLRALDKTVLLSGIGPYHELPSFLRRYTGERIVFLLGVPNLKEIFDPHYYADLPGGQLEGMGRLFAGDVKLAVYPEWDAKNKRYIEINDYRPPASCASIYQQLIDNKSIVSLPPLHKRGSALLPGDVLRMIRANDPAWSRQVPGPVARLIRKHEAFGYRSSPSGKRRRKVAP